MQRVFDGHNDMLLRLWRAGDLEGRRFLDGDGEGHLDLPRARAGGLAGRLLRGLRPGRVRAPRPPTRPTTAASSTSRTLGPVDGATPAASPSRWPRILLRMARARPDAIRLCRTVAEIEAAEAAGAIAAILHLEGAEAIGPDLGELEVLHAAGLRSLGPVWSRPNIFGTGVPFRFPGDPDEGPGLTEAGKELVRACNRLGILVDLSHLNAAGFSDVAALGGAPLVATHSNAHALSPASRNLTDAPARRHRRDRRRRRAQLRRRLPARRRPARLRHAARPR